LVHRDGFDMASDGPLVLGRIRRLQMADMNW